MDSAFMDFIEEVEHAKARLGCSNTGAFYRGHSKSTYKLIPSIFRENYSSSMEHNLYVDCYARGNHLIGNSRNSWEFLSIMQHFGIPTRLLDWSECLSIALFFAISRSHIDPVIWIINPFKLNLANKISDTHRIVTIGLDDFPDYERCFVRLKDKDDWCYQNSIFLQIPWTEGRIRNQKGFFTVHANSKPVEESCKKYVRCVPIKKDAINGVKKFLEYAGVNENVLYPDIDGFGRFLKNRYKI